MKILLAEKAGPPLLGAAVVLAAVGVAVVPVALGVLLVADVLVVVLVLLEPAWKTSDKTVRAGSSSACRRSISTSLSALYTKSS